MQIQLQQFLLEDLFLESSISVRSMLYNNCVSYFLQKINNLKQQTNHHSLKAYQMISHQDILLQKNQNKILNAQQILIKTKKNVQAKHNEKFRVLLNLICRFKIQQKHPSLRCTKFTIVTPKIRSVVKPLSLMPSNVFKMHTENCKYDFGNEQNTQLNTQRKNFHLEDFIDQDAFQKRQDFHQISKTVEIPTKRKPEQFKSVQKSEYKKQIQVKKISKQFRSITEQNTIQVYNNSPTTQQQYIPYPSSKNQIDNYCLDKEFWMSSKTSQFLEYDYVSPLRKLRKSFLCIFFLKIIQNLLKTCRQKQILKSTLNKCKKQLQQYSQKYLVYQKNIFMQNIANKILHYIKTKDYIQQCEGLGRICGSDFRKTNIVNITKLFYSNLELITRKNSFLKSLQSEMIIQLFYNQKRTTTYFVGQRCNFHNNAIFSIPIEQKLVIGLEYFFFQFLLPNILNLIRESESESINYKGEVFNNFLAIPSLFHKQFVNRFQKLPRLKHQNGNMIYNFFKLEQGNNNELHFNINEDNLNGDPDILIEGLISFEALENLENERPYWKNKINQLFDKICENFVSLMNL